MAYALLIIVIATLAAALFSIRHEINRLTGVMSERNQGYTRRKLSVYAWSKGLERLCESVNQNIDIQEQARIDARKQEQELRDSIANLSHDLRTPLTSILGYITLSKENPAKAPEYLAIAENKAKALRRLIDDLHNLSVIMDADESVEMEKIDASAALTECLLGSVSQFEDKGISPDIQIPDEAVYIFGNALYTQRIFQNLIQNAIKYACSEVSIILRGDGGKCVFSVSNDTNELTGESVKHIFERFYTAENARGSENHGLGLYIVKTLLEIMGGKVLSADIKDERFTIEIEFRRL